MFTIERLEYNHLTHDASVWPDGHMGILVRLLLGNSGHPDQCHADQSLR